MSSASIITPSGARYSRIMGVGGYRPERVIFNDELVEAIDSSDQWIRERTGIISRRWAAKDESVVDMAEAASRDAIVASGLEATQIDAVILATVTHPYQTPAAAPIVATRLGVQDAVAFDISAACAGYCHGIALASDMVRGGSATHVLVIGVEKLSDFTDLHDRSTAFIFGDGAGAAVVGPSDTPAIGPTVWGSDGSQWETIAQRESWTDLRDEWAAADESGGEHGWPPILMKGQAVFRWAVWGMAPVAQKALDAAGIRAEDLDAFIPHQANMRIIDSMIKQLALPPDIPVARDIAETANTSAASIPLATERMLREGQAPHGGLALQIGFGAGLVYAAQVVVLP
ncbi:3-oxoacyl-(acyl-carrier-protein) synthase 3 [Nostocoides japonicum T1-X7]|uniref:Beta-ketoacyl-[acyl-carrier-protein] synthase III n=1 Tax=Nostocoides japonicum T1-X7 TaxID=1194083 RepID=A0A077LWV3_9MICO|nr:beta-ketoacyl-ACP synthase III [Tetrasphaera japonica]CCH78408.1 3-oxoacyl-(acyl-carrier-protein) synthase 3 [Tetrasphaera japonica T1-X7]